LRLHIEEGLSDVDLGGLDLTSLWVEMAKGDHSMDFSRPLARELPRVDVSLRMGEGRVSNLGNTRSRDLHVDTRMGAFRVSLGGGWPAGVTSVVDIAHTMGDLTLLVPDEVRVDPGSSSKVIFGDSSSRGLRETDAKPTDAPILSISTTTSMGGIQIQRY
jgi:hypothetical protein